MIVSQHRDSTDSESSTSNPAIPSLLNTLPTEPVHCTLEALLNAIHFYIYYGRPLNNKQ